MCIYSSYIYMVCVCVCVLDSMNLFVSSNLGLKSFSNCLDPRLEIDSVWRCQAMSAALVIPFFSSDFHSTKKSYIPTSFGNLIDHRILLLFLPNVVHLLPSSILLFFLIFVTFGLLSRS